MSIPKIPQQLLSHGRGAHVMNGRKSPPRPQPNKL